MAVLLDEIQWGEPIVPAAADSAWDAELKKRLGAAPDYFRRVAPVPWLRRACLDWGTYALKAMPVRLADIGLLVTAQENSCRYCYGVARAHLRIVGFSEKQIGTFEKMAQIAEMDPKERLFVEYCRDLARSKPRPARAARDQLIEAGYSPLAVAEISFFISNQCFHNRVATLIACPPAYGFERVGRSVFARLFSPMMGKGNRGRVVEGGIDETPPAAFKAAVDALAGLPAAGLFARTVKEAFDSDLLSRRVKALMFAVVARQLDCSACGEDARELVLAEGLTGSEFESCIDTLSCPKLDPRESILLEWVRETIHYQPAAIQARTRHMVAELGVPAALEAIGISALANSTVRLATLL